MLKFALVTGFTKFDPDKAYFSQLVLDAICTFSFEERLVMKCVNTLYETRYSNYIGICPKKTPSKGYSICKYINWTGITGSVCIRNKYNPHLHSYLSGAQLYNLKRFIMGAWELKFIVFTFTTLTETNGTVFFCWISQ